MKRRLIFALAAFLAFFGVAEAACRNVAKDEMRFVVCEADPARDEIRLFLNDDAGAPFGDFGPLVEALGAKGETLAFAMNAGMYHKDRSPVGLYIENEKELRKLSTKDGPGNFHLKPNGVFFIWNEFDQRGAAVMTSDDYREKMEMGAIAYATQSGPMLVIDGATHPKFLADATSRKRRNGVGVRADGTAVFVLADTPVTFHEFAAYFRDDLGAPNALYLDGTISRLYAPELERNDPGLAMGPIIGVVLPAASLETPIAN